MMKYNRFEVDVKLTIGIDFFLEMYNDLDNSTMVKDKLKELIEQQIKGNLLFNDSEINKMEIRDMKNQGWLCSDDSKELETYLKNRKK